MKLLTVDGHWRWRLSRRPEEPPDLDAELVIKTPGRWIRFGVFFGAAPGSHMIGQHLTAWYTGRPRSAEVHGWNVRAGWWPSPCLTLLLHTRRPRRE